MLTEEELFNLAKSRYKEAKILLENNMPEGAVYLGGYAIELMLKRKIVVTLDWEGYPESRAEFTDKNSFKVHKLSALLHLSGLERVLQADTLMYAKWQAASSWDSEIRYRQIGKTSMDDARNSLIATKDILNYISKNT